MTRPGCSRKVVIVARSDRYANSVKPREMARHLRARGFEVDVVESAALGRLGDHGAGRWLPAPQVRALLLYLVEALQAVARWSLDRRSCRPLRYANGLTLAWMIRARGWYLASHLAHGAPHAVVAENQLDQAVVLHRVAPVQVLDLPSPLADELLYGQQLSERSHRRLRLLEERCLQRSDRASMHWPTYQAYVDANYRSAPRWIRSAYGVNSKRVTASFAAPPRVVFLGTLRGPWVNVPLLHELTAIYPDIDVWGEPPDQRWGSLNYRGYAPDLDILADYQVGLVTITDDPLRRSSFSSKQLEYYSYGLPVLVPEWRRDPLLEPASLPYGVDTFKEQLERLSDKAEWERLSRGALALAATFTWDAALAPLAEVLGS